MRPQRGKDRFHTVPIFSLVRNNFMKDNLEIRAYQTCPPTPSHLECRQEKFGTRMERIPTTRSKMCVIETR